MRPKPASINTPDGPPEPAARRFSIGGHVLTAPKAVPGLHLVATPIGNLGDITTLADPAVVEDLVNNRQNRTH